MADQTFNNDQNIPFADTGNNNNDAAFEQDPRDGWTSSSSTRSQPRDTTHHPRQNYESVAYEEIPVPKNA